MQKTVYILSGPAGVGKTTLWQTIKNTLPSIEKIITTTARDIRQGEIEGVDYYFVSKDEFSRLIQADAFIEFAVVHTNYYGSTIAELERIIAADRSPLYMIEPQGMIHMRPILERMGYRVVSIFLLPPSLDELKLRIKKRGTESEEQFQIRLATAIGELEQQDLYDIRLVNDDFDTTCSELIRIFGS